MFRAIAKKLFNGRGKRLTAGLSRAPAAHSCGLSPHRRVYNEFSGRRGLDATRYGDWEYAGRCTDFA